MERTTKAKMVSEFVFIYEELEPFGLESEQMDYMERVAREDLRQHNLPFMGGDVEVDFGYRYRPTVMTIII